MEVKLRKHRNLFLGILFAAATVAAWNFAHEAYTTSLGMIETGGRPHHFNLGHVAQRLGEYPDLTLEQWLGAQGAGVARGRRTEYRGRCAAALLSGFMAVFFLGMYLDEVRGRDTQALEPGPTA